MNAEALSSSASRCSASPASTTVPVNCRPSSRSADPGVPFVAPGPLRQEGGEHRQADRVGPGTRRSVVPAGGVGVREAVGDVEPAEVVEQVALAGRVVAHHPLADGLDHDVEDPVDAGPAAHRIGDGGNDGLAVVAQERRQERAVVVPAVVDRERGECREIRAGERAHERPGVRQHVLAGAVDDGRHEVRQHGVGALPADELEQLERLLAVDRSVAVRQQVVADDRREPRLQICGAIPAVDRAADQCLGLFELLGLDSVCGTRRAGSAGSCRAGSGSGLTGRSRSVSAMPAIACTIGRARWSPS